jgi:hypothetical protein
LLKIKFRKKASNLIHKQTKVFKAVSLKKMHRRPRHIGKRWLKSISTRKIQIITCEILATQEAEIRRILI